MALRLFRRSDAGASTLIVLVLALGIGGNAAIFSLMKTAFWDPLPYPHADRLVTLFDAVPDRRIQRGVNLLTPTISEFLEIRIRSRVLEQIAALNHRDYQLTGTEEPARVVAAQVTASFFPLFGTGPLLGRAFSAEENVPGRNQVVILTNGFWKSRMGADSNAIGKVLRLNGDPYVIVGVLPSGFSFDYPNLRIAEPAEIYVPLPLEDTLTSGVTRGQSSIADQVRVFGRIRGDATHDQAATELAGIARELFPPENRIPGQTGDRFFQAQPLREAIVGNQRSVLWLLMGGIAVLLLIACANTAQLLLARSLSRGREVAIRAALWARRGCD